jgi:hypothetical protein
MKKLLLLLLLFALLGFVFSDSITSYVVPSSVSLGQTITASGLYSDANTTLCSFYFFDASSGALVTRATSQYTSGTGRFALAGFPITEPRFKRDSNYLLQSECGNASASLSFVVSQRETVAFWGQQEFNYVTNNENLDTVFIWGAIVLFAGFIGSLVWFLLKWARRR